MLWRGKQRKYISFFAVLESRLVFPLQSRNAAKQNISVCHFQFVTWCVLYASLLSRRAMLHWPSYGVFCVIFVQWWRFQAISSLFFSWAFFPRLPVLRRGKRRLHHTNVLTHSQKSLDSRSKARLFCLFIQDYESQIVFLQFYRKIFHYSCAVMAESSESVVFSLQSHWSKLIISFLKIFLHVHLKFSLD